MEQSKIVKCQHCGIELIVYNAGEHSCPLCGTSFTVSPKLFEKPTYVKFRCEHCGTEYKADSKRIGEQFECAVCGKTCYVAMYDNDDAHSLLSNSADESTMSNKEEETCSLEDTIIHVGAAAAIFIFTLVVGFCFISCVNNAVVESTRPSYGSDKTVNCLIHIGH